MGFFEEMNDYMAKMDRDSRKKGMKWQKITIIAAIMMFVFFLITNFTTNSNIGIWTKLLENNATTQATLTVKDMSNLFVKGYQISYVYTVDGKEYTSTQVLSQDEYEKLGGVTTQMVHYDPENPSVIAIQQALDTAKGQQSTLLWGTIAMGGLVVLLVGARWLTHKDWVPAGFELVGVCDRCKHSLIRPLTPEARREARSKYRGVTVYTCDDCGKATCGDCHSFSLMDRGCSCGGGSITVTSAYIK